MEYDAGKSVCGDLFYIIFFIVHNFEVILKKTNIVQTDDLFFSGETISLTINIAVAIYDNLTVESSFAERNDAKYLLQTFTEYLEKRQYVVDTIPR